MSETLRVVLEAVAQPFHRDMKQGEEAVRQFSKNSRIELTQFKNFMAGAFTVGAAVKFTNDLIRMGSQIYHNAQAVGLSTDAFQALEVQTSEAGGSTEALRNALGRLQQQQDAAIEGNEKAAQSFARLGISVEEVAGLDMEGLYLRIARGVGEAEDKTQAYAAVAEIFGRRVGPQLWEALNNLATLDWTAYQDGLRQAGQIMDSEITQKLAEAEDAIARFWRSVRIFAANQLVVGGFVKQDIQSYLSATKQVLQEDGVKALFSRESFNRREDIRERQMAEYIQARADNLLNVRNRMNLGENDLARQARLRRLEENRAAAAGAVVEGNDPAARAQEEMLRIQQSLDARMAAMVRHQEAMLRQRATTFEVVEI